MIPMLTDRDECERLRLTLKAVLEDAEHALSLMPKDAPARDHIEYIRFNALRALTDEDPR